MKKEILFILASLILLSTSSLNAQNTQKFSVDLRYRSFIPDANLNFNPEIFSKELFNNKYYLAVQFYELPDENIQNDLRKNGIHLISFISGTTYWMTVEKDQFNNLKNFPTIRSVFALETSDKFQKELINNLPSYAIKEVKTVDVAILFHPEIRSEQILSEIERLNLKTLYYVPRLNNMVVRLPEDRIIEIASQPWVQWMELIPPPMVEENRVEKTDHRANILNAKYTGARNLTGKGVRVGEWDGGQVGSHQDINDRVIVKQKAYAVSSHATHVSGTVMGAGLLDEQYEGMAPEVINYSWDFWDWIPWEMDSSVYQDSIVITQNSYAYDSRWDTCKFRGYYDIYSYLFDRLVALHPYFVHVFAAGNYQSQCYSSGFRTISSGPQSAKNTISVGALSYDDKMSSYSSWGPIRDGRIKPEVSAVGSNVMSTYQVDSYGAGTGTSMACPGTSGTIALLYQRYRQLFNSEPDASMIKAVLCNSALDLGNAGPDFKFGFGRIDGLKAVTTFEDKRFHFDSVSNGKINYDTINIGSDVKQLKILINWSDVPVNTNANLLSSVLVNNLDLLVYDKNVTRYYPFVLDTNKPNVAATTGIDSLNNIEQVVITNPTIGDWIIGVKGTKIPLKKQTYTVTYELIKNEIFVIYPSGGESLLPGTTATIRWNSYGQSGNFKVEFSADNGKTWQTLSSTISSSTLFYNWTVPSINSSKCLIRVSNGAMTGVSDTTFSIMYRPSKLFKKSCNKQVHLYWQKVINAASYDVFVVEKGQWKFYEHTTDTFSTVVGLDNKKTYLFSVSAIDSTGAVSPKSLGFNASPDSTEFPPFIKIKPIIDTFCMGSSTVLTVKLTGDPTINKQWQYSTDHGKTWTNISGATDTFLAINNIQRNMDGYLYRAFFTNHCLGYVFTNEVYLHVDSFITFTQVPYNITGCIGDSNGIKVSLNAVNPINLIWQESTDSGKTWNDMSGETKNILVFDSFTYSLNLFQYRIKAKTQCIKDTFSSSSVVNVNPQLSVYIKPSSDTICYGKTVQLFAIPFGGDSNAYHFLWKHDSSTFSGISDTLISTTSYQVFLFDSCSNTAVTDSITIVVRNPLSLKLTSSADTICIGQNAKLNAQINGGNPSSYHYFWKKQTSDISQIIVDPTITTTYVVTVFDSCSLNALTDSITVFVLDPLHAKISSGKDTFCFGESIQLTSKLQGGKPMNYSFDWDNGLNQSNSFSFKALNSAWHYLKLADNCTSLSGTDSIYIFVKQPLQLQLFSSADTICIGEVANIYSVYSGGDSNNYHFNWNNNLPPIDSNVVSPEKTKSYVLTLTDNCTIPDAMDSITIVVRSGLEVKISGNPDSVCIGEQIKLTAIANGGNSENYQFKWNLSTINKAELTDFVYKKSTYKVTLEDQCTLLPASDSVEIFVRLLNADWQFSANNKEVQFSPMTSVYSHYLWTFGDGDSSKFTSVKHTYKKTGTYLICLTVTDQNGCDSTYCNNISVKDIGIGKEPEYPHFEIFPNSNDGLFTFYTNADKLNGSELKIFNLLGKKIFETSPLYSGYQIDLRGIPAGLYLIEFVSEGQIYTSKLIIK